MKALTQNSNVSSREEQLTFVAGYDKVNNSPNLGSLKSSGSILFVIIAKTGLVGWLTLQVVPDFVYDTDRSEWCNKSLIKFTWNVCVCKPSDTADHTSSGSDEG